MESDYSRSELLQIQASLKFYFQFIMLSSLLF
jgi:hypothetical protein